MAKVDSLVSDIEQRIRTGQLLPGDRLPPVRQYADEHGLAPGTVAAAYRTLSTRGLVHGEGRRGTFVSPKPSVRSHVIDTVADDCVDLAQGNPDLTLLPDLGAALAAIPSAHVLYPGPQVVPELGEIFVADVEADGLVAEHLAVVSGALDGIERVLAVHTRPGDTIAVEDPCYHAVLDLVLAMGLRPVPVAIDEFGPDPERLKAAIEAGADVAIITPRAQNPTGAALSAERAHQLRDVLETHGHVLVIEDDHAGPIAGVPHVSTIDPDRDRWAITRSMAKSLGPDLRVSALVGDEVTISRVRGRQAVGTGWVSQILQRLVVAMRTDPDYDARIDRAAATYADRRNALVDRLHTAGIASPTRSGLNVWVPVNDEAAAVAAMQRRGWAIRSGAAFRLDASPGVRITTANRSVEQIAEFADAFIDVIGPRPAVRTA